MRAQLLPLLLALGAAAPALAGGVCLKLGGCAPTNYQECVQAAAEDGKTEAGTKALVRQCDRFKVSEPVCRADAATLVEERAHPSAMLVEVRKKVPELAGMDDDQAVDFLQQVYYPDQPRERIAARAGVALHPDRPLCREFFGDLYRSPRVSGASAPR